MIPLYLKHLLEDFGLEEDVSFEDGMLYIKCANFDEAYEVRKKILQAEAHHCHLYCSLAGEVSVAVHNLIDSNS